MNALTRLVDHPDLDVRAMALAACQSLPDVSALLALSDRFGELDDTERQDMSRRLAVVMNKRPKRVIRFRANAIPGAFNSLKTDLEAIASIWLFLRWVGPDPTRIRPVVRHGLLAALRLQNLDVSELLRKVETPSGEPGTGVLDLWEATHILLYGSDLDRASAPAIARLAAGARVGYSELPFDRAVNEAHGMIGGCIERISGQEIGLGIIYPHLPFRFEPRESEGDPR